MGPDTTYGPRRSLTKNQLRSALAVELVDLLENITADGKIDAREARMLHEWLDDRDVAELPSIGYLRTILDHVLQDNQITQAECLEIYKAVEKVLPAEARREAKNRRQAVETIARLQKQKDKANAVMTRRRSTPVKTANFMVAGVSHDGRAGVIQKFVAAGDQAFLVREPGNRYDANAIGILIQGGYKIGYVPKEIAADLAPLLDQSMPQKAVITKLLEARRYYIPVVDVQLFAVDTTVEDVLTPDKLPKETLPPFSTSDRSIHERPLVRDPLPSEPSASGCGAGCMHGCAVLSGIVILLMLASVAC